MQVHNLRLMDEYRLLYGAGLKSLEVRVGDPRIKAIKIGDIIIFADDQNCRFQVKRIAVYSTHVAMLEKEDYKKIHPDKTKVEILGILQKIYPWHREKRGVYVFELEPA